MKKCLIPAENAEKVANSCFHEAFLAVEDDVMIQFVNKHALSLLLFPSDFETTRNNRGKKKSEHLFFWFGRWVPRQVARVFGHFLRSSIEN